MYHHIEQTVFYLTSSSLGVAVRLLLCHSVVISILKYYGQECQKLLTGQCICLLVYYPSPVHELSYLWVPELQVELNVLLWIHIARYNINYKFVVANFMIYESLLLQWPRDWHNFDISKMNAGKCHWYHKIRDNKSAWIIKYIQMSALYCSWLNGLIPTISYQVVPVWRQQCLKSSTYHSTPRTTRLHCHQDRQACSM